MTERPQTEQQQSVVPRDVRLLHLIFATQGIQNYEDHVPLQLMDFAHSKCQINLHIFKPFQVLTDNLRIH